MRRLLPALLLLALAAPAHADDRPQCVKRLKFVHYNVRVAKLPDGGMLACQARSRKSHPLFNAHSFNAAGRWLTYIDGDGDLRRLNIRSGDRVRLDRGPTTFITVTQYGHAVWTSLANNDVRLRMWDQSLGQVKTLVGGADLDPNSFAFSANVTPYWTDDGLPYASDLDQSWSGPHDYVVPSYQRTKRPLCKQNVIFLRGIVRVVRTSRLEMTACGPGGQSFALGEARDFVAAGPWLVYADRVPGQLGLHQLNVRTGERRALHQPDWFNAFLDGLNPDGTVAFTDLNFTNDAVYQNIRIWPAGAPEPITVEESVAPRESQDYEGIEQGTAALADDGTLYWRDEDEVVRSRPPTA